MRKVIFESSISIDGFIEGPNGELDWMKFDETAESEPVDFLSAFDTIFCGRKTYERMVIPANGVEGLSYAERNFFYALYGMRKYVFSRSRKHVEGNGMVICEDLQAEVSRIRDEVGKNIWFCGGADILKTFQEYDLVDEYLITVHPVTLKTGKPLFTGPHHPPQLALIDKQRLRSGLTILHYRPESRLKTFY